MAELTSYPLSRMQIEMLGSEASGQTHTEKLGCKLRERCGAGCGLVLDLNSQEFEISSECGNCTSSTAASCAGEFAAKVANALILDSGRVDVSLLSHGSDRTTLPNYLSPGHTINHDYLHLVRLLDPHVVTTPFPTGVLLGRACTAIEGEGGYASPCGTRFLRHLLPVEQVNTSRAIEPGEIVLIEHPAVSGNV